MENNALVKFKKRLINQLKLVLIQSILLDLEMKSVGLQFLMSFELPKKLSSSVLAISNLKNLLDFENAEHIRSFKVLSSVTPKSNMLSEYSAKP